MIKNIIFDFGDVFIDLNRDLFKERLENLGIVLNVNMMQGVYSDYEKGLTSTEKFIKYHSDFLGVVSEKEIVDVWNSILGDFPLNRLLFLEALSNKYNLYLLSNTNALHIDFVKKNKGMDFYNRFVNCFQKVYYSYEIHLRKPDKEIFEFVLRDAALKAKETLFVDDLLENIDAANTLGIKTWNLQVGKEDVTSLFEVKRKLLKIE